MRFNFLVLINLAVVSTIGSSNFNLNSYLRHPLPINCLHFVETIKHFNNCQVSEEKPVIEYGAEALPYVCLLYLDVVAELCKAPDLLKKMSQPSSPKPVCPMGHALKPSNLRIDITKGVEYMSDEVKCKGVCEFSPYLSSICQFISLANETINEGKSVGESLDNVKGGDNQSFFTNSFHSPEKDGTVSLAGPVGISQDTKLAQETKPKVSPEQPHEKIVQSMTDDKFDNKKQVKKTEGVTINKKTSAADLDMTPNLGSKGPNGSTDKNNNYKVSNYTNSSNVRVNKTVLKNDTLINNENYKTKASEINKSQILPSNNGNTDIPGTESPPPIKNDYSSKTQQNNVKINDKNNNNNNNNMEFEEDSAVKTPHDEGEDDDDNNNEDIDKSALQDTLLDEEPQFAKSVNQKEIYSGDNFFQAEDSHFSVYFLTTVLIIIIGYVIYHNKKKILAYALEGRRNKNGRRRPTSASYRKLDCNLEEAIASNPSNTSVTNVVY